MRNRKTFQPWVNAPRARLLLVALLSLTLLATGCPKDQLKKAANYGNSATQGLSALQDLAINLNQAGKLDDQKTSEIIRGVPKANAALQTAKNTVSFIQRRVEAGGELNAQDQADLRTLFNAFGQAVQELNQSGVLGVKNAESKDCPLTTALAGYLPSPLRAKDAQRGRKPPLWGVSGPLFRVACHRKSRSSVLGPGLVSR